MAADVIPILRIGATLLVSVQLELRDAIADRFQEDVLRAIEKGGAQGLLIDITGVEIIDTYVARTLAEMGRMAKLMGVDTVLAGMKPELALTLVRMGYRMEGMEAVLDIEEGLKLLRRRQRARAARRR
jgi:rsbT antagonist protein RsbS